jgi:hypothetical protein
MVETNVLFVLPLRILEHVARKGLTCHLVVFEHIEGNGDGVEQKKTNDADLDREAIRQWKLLWQLHCFTETSAGHAGHSTLWDSCA